MVYLPTRHFEADGADIFEYVVGCRWANGMNVISNPNGRSRLLPAGTLALDNQSGYWTESRLRALDTITVRVDSHYVCEAVVESYTNFAPSNEIRLKLNSLNATNYKRLAVFCAVANLSATEVLAEVGTTITALTPWGAAETAIGVDYSKPLSTFLDDFGILFDSYVFEDGRGNLRAVNPSTENRIPPFIITPQDYQILLRTANAQYRPGWRRDAQELITLDASLSSVDVIYAEDMDVRNSDVDNINGGSGTSALYRLELKPYEQGSVGGQDNHAFFTWVLAERDIDELIDGPSGTSPFTTYDVTQSGTSIFVFIRYNGQDSSEYTISDMVFNRDFTVTIYNYTGAFENVVNRILVDPTVEHGYLPRNRIQASNSTVAITGAKLERYAGYIPQVSRLTFNIKQDNQARFDEIAALQPGDVVDSNILDGNLDIRARGHVLYTGWNFPKNGRATKELHLVSYQDLTDTDFLLWYGERLLDYDDEPLKGPA